MKHTIKLGHNNDYMRGNCALNETLPWLRGNPGKVALVERGESALNSDIYDLY
jgi:hypothetical protein